MTPSRALKLLVALVVIYFGAQFVSYVRYQTRYFTIEKIEISGNRYLFDETILKHAGVQEQQTLYEVKIPEVTEKLMSNPYVRSVSVKRVLPATLLIDVREREPILYLIDQSIYMVDEQGVTLPRLPTMPTGKRPIITGVSMADLQADSTRLAQTVQLVREMNEVDATMLSFVSEIHVSPQGVPEPVLIRGAARVRLGDDQHYSRLYLLSQFLQKEPIVNRLGEFKTIDLRFAGRIVVQRKS